MDFPVAAVVKNPTASAGGTKDMDSVPGLGRSPGVGNGNLLQYSCLENLMDKGVWRLESVRSQRVRQDWAHICLCIADSLCYTAETNTFQTNKN